MYQVVCVACDVIGRWCAWLVVTVVYGVCDMWCLA